MQSMRSMQVFWIVDHSSPGLQLGMVCLGTVLALAEKKEKEAMYRFPTLPLVHMEAHTWEFPTIRGPNIRPEIVKLLF